MNKFTRSLPCFFLFSFSNISAQVDAGVIANLSVNSNTPAETVNIVPIFWPGQPYNPEAIDSLDLNRDGQYDVWFYCSSCNIVDCIGGTTSLTTLHTNVELMMDTDNELRQLNTGDVIDNNQIWGAADFSILTHRVYGIGGYTELGNWFPQMEGFAGVRIFSGLDTLYGWIKIKAFANPNGGAYVQVFQWAIEEETTSNQSVDFVISGITSNLIPGSDTMTLIQETIPFGGGTGKVDSLDLNQDGIHDVAFNATICNTFDCIQSSTLCIGMHEGFNFVMGPTDARQFDTGDTIFANANWNATPTPHKVGLFAQQGLGFNGFQSAGEWLNDNEGYLGFRLVTPASDTLLGWIHIYTYSLAENGAYLEILGWAIQHDPSQKPYVEVAKTPEKPVYCNGDYVMFEANTVGAEQIAWHFWDGSTDTSTVAVKILPDSTVAVTFEATNPNGTTTVVQTLEVSALMLTAPDIVLNCYQPSGILTAETNIPANICWVVGNDTTCNPTPPAINFPTPITVFAEDEYGCIAVGQVEILLDTNIPDASIEYDEMNHLLIAHSSTPGAIFMWTGGPATEPAFGDSVFIAQSGTYNLTVTAPNGCFTTLSISVVLTAVAEPFAESVRVQPNPASDFLQIENRLASDLYFKILDAAGSLTMESGAALANSLTRLDVEFLPSGFYFLAAYDVAGKPLFFKKFVKQ